jgi:hypothetical protein
MKEIKKIRVAKLYEGASALIIKVNGILDGELLHEIGEYMCDCHFGFTATVDRPKNTTELVFVTDTIENGFEIVSGYLKWQD